MARRTNRPPITRTVNLIPVRRQCSTCGGSLWKLYQTQRTITTLEEVTRLTVTVVRCHNPACADYHQPYRPEEEGAWALPHGEFGLDDCPHRHLALARASLGPGDPHGPAGAARRHRGAYGHASPG